MKHDAAYIRAGACLRLIKSIMPELLESMQAAGVKKTHREQSDYGRIIKYIDRLSSDLDNRVCREWRDKEGYNPTSVFYGVFTMVPRNKTDVMVEECAHHVAFKCFEKKMYE